MRILHFFLFAILLKNVYCHSSNPLLKLHCISISKLAKVRPQVPAPQVISYILAVTWPTGACTGNSGIKCEITPVPTEFKIQGLWPQPNGPPSNETFTRDTLIPIADNLTEYWPNLRSKDQERERDLIFWRYEWTHRGKYSALGALEYFNKALELFKGAGQGLKEKLVAEQITPSLCKMYTREAIEAALKKINGGFSCSVICNHRNTSKKEKQIQEIRFMYTKDFKMRDYPVTSSTCGNATTEVMFPLPL